MQVGGWHEQGYYDPATGEEVVAAVERRVSNVGLGAGREEKTEPGLNGGRNRLDPFPRLSSSGGKALRVQTLQCHGRMQPQGRGPLPASRLAKL